MTNIQVITGSDDGHFTFYQATDEEFSSIFPKPGQDIEVVEDYIDRVGEPEAHRTLSKLWERAIHKRDVNGVNGTLYYDWKRRSESFPNSKRELDRDPRQMNLAQRSLYEKMRNCG